MRRIFLWFYCLDIEVAVLWVLAATAAFLLIRRRLEKTKYWKAAVAVLFACWLGVILLGTVGDRSSGGENRELFLIPFYSYHLAANGGNKELYRENFMNCVLFYPAGLLGFELMPKKWKRGMRALVLTAGMLLLSVSIEYCQYRFALGLVETDDVIHNTVGTLLGILAGSAAWNRKNG